MHTEYLEAKRSIDDRSMNRHVWDAFLSCSADLVENLNRPLRIGEIGAGSGTMVDRLRQWRYFELLSNAGCTAVEYHGWEQNPDAARHISGRLEKEPLIIDSNVFVTDVTDPASEGRIPAGGYDILIGHAVLDLFSPETLVTLLERFLRPGGCLYGSIVFDGVTVFGPEWDRRIDAAVMECYHRTMTSGGFARNHLLHLTSRGFPLLAVGSSDWIIPPRKGGMSADENQLVRTILSMVESSVGELPESESLGRSELEGWLVHRRGQLKRGELLFEAHQLDMLVQR